MAARFTALANIRPKNGYTNGHNGNNGNGVQKTTQISEIFGSLVFGQEAIKKYLLKEAYDSLMISIETGQQVDRRTADFVAVGMKNWALDRGVTHYTHWFQPLTGKTAEKHDSFFQIFPDGIGIEEFDGNTLIQQEPDASSFPSGGLRNTSEARGYTVWDPSSPAFILETSHGKTLCIPSIFISYTGESLDLKTPLLKSTHLLEKAGAEVCHYFDPNVKKVMATLGWEQEYFIIDEALYNARPDLAQCGRTLFGSLSARGQQLEDHYFASIPERVHDYMIDFENECLKLGIPIKTRHNEVAPSQFECAPHFEYVNIAADHNQLLMDVMERVAKRHKLRALLHEKPYAGVNGSGKHNNWSMSTDTGKNLLSPGKNPKANLQFLTFYINVIKAVHKYANVLRASIANVGNEHRLGANEAPPAIISIFTGTNIAKILTDFKSEVDHLVAGHESATTLNLNVSKVSEIQLDTTDRNRTSPFPFTGNKFEFRAVGSSANVSSPMTVLNLMVATQLINFKKEVDTLISSGDSKEIAIAKVLRSYLNESEAIIFNGDNYSEEWVVEAEHRGLPNIKTTPEALAELLSNEAKELFVENHIFTERELDARYNIYIEEYIKKIEIESLLVEELANTHIVPAVIGYQNQLISNAQGLIAIGLSGESEVMKSTISKISEHLQGAMSKVREMAEARHHAHDSHSHSETAFDFCLKVKPLCDAIRSHVDALEQIVDDKSWPLPKYREMLFMH